MDGKLEAKIKQATSDKKKKKKTLEKKFKL
jgi:hypothetical protein